ERHVLRPSVHGDGDHRARQGVSGRSGLPREASNEARHMNTHRRRWILVGAALVILRVNPIAQPRATTTAIVGATVIDGNGGPPIADGVIVVNGSRTTAVGPRGAVTIPPDAARVDAGGRWIVPGLIDTNVHLSLYGGQNDRYETLVRYQAR